MENLLKQWDGEEMIIRFDRPTGAWILIAVHSTRLGAATGGTRIKSYRDVREALQDAMNLGAGMTHKFAAAGIMRGGGKAVIAVPPDLDPDARLHLLRRYGTLLQQLGGLFETGVDVGTTPADMDIIAENGAPYVFCRTVENGGAGDASPFTALGVLSGMQATCEQVWGEDSLGGKRVMVQGAGSVGRRLIKLLREAEAEVMFSDVDPSAIAYHRDELGLRYIEPKDVYDAECDIFAPCALGAVLNADTIPRLKCRAVAGAANNQLASVQDADRLHERQILYAPDYVINAGGAMAIFSIEITGRSHAEAEQQVSVIGQTLRQLYTEAAAEGISTEAAARRSAERRLAEAG